MVKDHGGKTRYSVSFRDASSVTSKDVNVFSADILRRKDVKTITFSFRDEWMNKSLDVRLAEEFVFSTITNTYDISSTDEDWYNATLSQVNVLLATLPKHIWIRRMFDFPQVILSFAIYWMIAFGLMAWPLGFELGIRTEDAKIFIPFSGFLLGGIILFAIITLTVYALCPDMEFDFDMPRGISRKRMRKAIGWIMGTIAFPVVLSLMTR